MCWMSREPVKQVAEEDIPVFKIVNKVVNNLRSIYNRFDYKIGKSYSTKMEEPQLWTIETSIIRKGFHSYSIHCTLRKHFYTIESSYIIIKGEDSSMLDSLSGLEHCVRMNCIIPKGAEYYLNKSGEYVSNQIKVISIEDVLDKLKRCNKTDS